MISSSPVDRLRVATPCHVGWERMEGNGRVRFCSLCQLNVYNIAELSRAETETLIAQSEGRICARLFRRSDGTVITRDCPVGLRALRLRVARTAAAVFATLVSFCGIAIGQKNNDKNSCQQQVQITRKVEPGAQTPTLEGRILDPIGAVVPGARIELFNRATKKTFEWISDNEGRYTARGLTEGKYDITVQMPGFRKVRKKDVTIGAGETVRIDMTLIVDTATVLVGVIAEESLIDTPPGTTIIKGELIRKLPIF